MKIVFRCVYHEANFHNIVATLDQNRRYRPIQTRVGSMSIFGFPYDNDIIVDKYRENDIDIDIK